MLLRELFMQRLLANVQLVLATANAMALLELTALADMVIDVAAPPASTAAVSPPEPTAPSPILYSSPPLA